ncbi:hypothetical protein RBH26_06910 [Natronolimnohabitans sp. A-GB9]|uniref:hypothetical protein n=1 Tax=Natronolimnohabitans sp. A-GB9 TaxID=3069757 RepID=UPI0027B4F998|nr:hypothetical protein [Natronolimnohabitans sp. A-GB9]MDQ2050212.1 hypothetical protein [Natronolimnohabitans sp. A-GB9]
MIDAIAQFRDVIFVSVYVLFFLGSLGALALANRSVLRRIWLVGFFSTLLVVTAVGMPLLPVVEMHKFAQPSEEEMTYYEIHVVDADGQEIELDDRATPPLTGTRTSSVGGELAEEYSDAERMEMGEFYLEHVREYRQAVESGDRSVTERLQPPRYVDDPAWTTDQLSEYEAFESIRVYERTVIYAEDDSSVESNEKRLRLTVDVADDEVIEHT